MSEVVQFVKRIIRGVRGQAQIKRRLIKKGFNKVDEGCYKTVLRHPDYSEFVVKVYVGSRTWTFDSYAPLPKRLQEFWLKPIYSTQRFQIQPFADDIGGSHIKAYSIITDFLLDLNIRPLKYDIHEGNCRFHNGKPYIIDYSRNSLK
jgi:hypothetical protein